MITTIVEARWDDKQLKGDEVTVQQIQQLSDHFFRNILIVDLNGETRAMDSSDGKDPKKNDTRTITFKKDRIDESFKLSGTNELVINLGLHNSAIYNGGQPKEYEQKVMVVLSDKKIAHLDVNDKVIIAGVGDGGLDNGKLCPPHPDCV